jgi:hypothetical protein
MTSAVAAILHRAASVDEALANIHKKV